MMCSTRVTNGAMALAIAASMATVARAEQKSREQRQAAHEVYFSSGDEPPSMDPTKQADTVSNFWLGHLFEGLMMYDKAGNIVPGTAESFKVSADKKTWTFTIRKTAKWHDGQPVKAQDFEYTMKRLVDPAYASEYAFIAGAAGLLNAEDIVAKKKAPSELGVKALSDSTLEIHLSRPVPYFDSLMAFQIFYPVRKDIVEKAGDKFATNATSIVGNGPYKMVSWQKEQSMRIEKAATYWNAAAIKITAIESPSMVKDAQANFNSFQTGGIDFNLTNTPEIIKQAQDAKLKIQTFPSGCVEYLALNTRAGHPFASQELRLALQAGTSRAEFVNKIIGVPGYKAMFGIVPDYLPGSKPGSTYRKEAPLPFKDADLAASKKHLDAFFKETKQTSVPTFTILSGDSSRAKKYAEYYQSALAKLFKADVKVETVPFKTRLQKSRDGQYDVEMSGWCPDYRDAMTYMDLYTSKNDNNTTGWSNKQFDTLIDKAANEPDLVARVKDFAEAEKMLAAFAPIVPTDQSGGAYVVTPNLKGVKRNVFGVDPDFRFAEWDAKGSPSH